jgi:plasmid stability protein
MGEVQRMPWRRVLPLRHPACQELVQRRPSIGASRNAKTANIPFLATLSKTEHRQVPHPQITQCFLISEKLLALTAMHVFSEATMNTLTIRNLDSAVKDKLRTLAARHGRSMEAEVREILREAVTSPKSDRGLGSRIHARFAAGGGV